MSMMNTMPFDAEKALEALVYVVARTPTNDLYKALKTPYIADKLHLDRYGRFIYGETYSALPQGPVPQHAYDCAKVLDGTLAKCTVPTANLKRALNRPSARKLLALRPPDLETLSRSDVECLDEAIRDVVFDDMGELMRKTHDAAWKKASRGAAIPLEDIIATLPKQRRAHVTAYLNR